MAEPTPTATPTPPTPPAAAAAAAKVPPRPIPAGLRPLIFMGVPESVLHWRPKPPSRNTSIFLVVTSTLVSLWYYDRQECERIRQEYIDRVKHLAGEPLKPYEYPRKIQIYGAKSPGDDDYDKSIRYFKRYVKPVLVAAGLDFESLNGRRYGGLAREIKERTYARRRQLLGLEPWGCDPSSSGGEPVRPDSMDALKAQAALQSPFALTPQAQLQRELDGAVVIMGRPAYKEFMWGLKEGWTTPLPPQRQDVDEPLAKLLAEDDKFDEVVEPKETQAQVDVDGAASPAVPGATVDGRPEEELDDIERRNRALAASADDDEGAPLPSRLPNQPMGAFGSAGMSGMRARAEAAPAAPQVDPALLAPPEKIPAQPPLVFVDYVNRVGWRQIPMRMYLFFKRRDDVRAGGEAALRIVLGDKSTAEDFDAPLVTEGALASPAVREQPPQGGHLDWGLEGEALYPPRFGKLLKDTEDARKSYYEALPRRLKDTRTLVRGQREPSRLEKNDPPKTEAQLKEERLAREKEWRGDELGHSILSPDAGVAWSEAFRGALRVMREQSLRTQGEEAEAAAAAAAASA